MVKDYLKEIVANRKVKASLCVVASLFAMIGLIVSPMNETEKVKGEGSTVPRFNFMEGDAEMLRVGKTTDTVWTDPLTANAGDRVAYLFYYHNGMINTTAHHTKVRVDLPLEQSTTLTAKSWLWSQETAAISDTVVNGQIVGRSGATINTATPSRLQYVAGSTKWFPNGSQTATAMPDGIISDSGLDLGDIQGCWDYAGYVTFLVDVKAPAQLVMDKTVAHPGESSWHEEITANPGDSIAYHLGIRNDGGTTASAVTVKDLLPTYMTYETGTTYIYTSEHPEGIKQADTLFTTGINLPDVLPGQSNVIYVTYRTKIDANMPTGAFALNNVAQVLMGGVIQDQDQAKVTVTASRGLVIDKQVSNGVSWVEQNTAKLGDRIDYRIIIRNTGNVAITNVYLKDILPVFVTYVNGSTKIDGVQVSDEITSSNGLLIGTLGAGQQKVITLSGKIYGCPPVGGYTLTNTAYTWGNSVNEVNDSAITVVNVTSPQAPKL